MDPPAPTIHVESWLVSAGRDPAPGSPLNVPLVPVDDTAGWVRACGDADLIWLAFLGESVTPRLVLASAAILGGIALVLRERRLDTGAHARR